MPSLSRVLIAMIAAGAMALFAPPPLSAQEPTAVGTTAQVALSLTGLVEKTLKGKQAIVLDGKTLLDEGWIVLVKGTSRVSERHTPAKAGSALPTKLRFQLIHKDKNGKVLETVNFDAVVRSDGTIAQQSFPYDKFIQVAPGEIVESVVVPLDRTLPPGTMNLSVSFQPPSAPALRAPVAGPLGDKPLRMA